MLAIDILQEIRTEAEQLLAKLDSKASRIYEITTVGTIVERTAPMQLYYRNIIEKLQCVIDLLRK
jgi:hypothetical protein